MFWDVYDLPFDSDKQKEVKRLRRKSNYYEEVYEDLQSNLAFIDQTLSSIKSEYRVYEQTMYVATDDVAYYKYMEKKKIVLQAIQSIINVQTQARNHISNSRDIAYNQYIYYQNRAWRED